MATPKGGNRGGIGRDRAWDSSDVTPSNTVDLPDGICTGIYVGVAGDVKVDMGGGTAQVWKNLASGLIHPICAKRVYVTGTTATSIVAVY